MKAEGKGGDLSRKAWKASWEITREQRGPGVLEMSEWTQERGPERGVVGEQVLQTAPDALVCCP